MGAGGTMEIGDLQYFTAPPTAARARSPRCRRMSRLLAASVGALLWVGLLLASVGAAS
jgi:hypothetical protein